MKCEIPAKYYMDRKGYQLKWIAGVDAIPDSVDIEFFKDNSFYHLNEFEKMELRLLLAFLNVCNWSQKDAAKRLGISQRAMNAKIVKWGIKCDKWSKNCK